MHYVKLMYVIEESFWCPKILLHNYLPPYFKYYEVLMNELYSLIINSPPP